MKKYIWALIIGITAFACADEKYESAFREYVGINTTGVPAKVAENSAGISIPLVFGGNSTNSRAVTVNYSIEGGTYGTNYTVVGGSGASGSVTIPAGKLGTEAATKIVVKGVGDFVFEPDVKLTITLTSADNNVAVGFPFKQSYAFTIADDDCPFEFEGDLDGDDVILPDGTTVDASVKIYDRTETEFTMEGLGTGMIDELWAETPVQLYPVTVKVAQGGALTIEEQSVFDTDYKGDIYEYSIVGTGQINFCDGTISFNYDIFYTNGDGSVSEQLGLKAIFAAEIKPVEEE